MYHFDDSCWSDAEPRVCSGDQYRAASTVYGTGAPNAHIELTVGGERHGALTDELGNWHVRLRALAPGMHALRITQCDAHDVRTVEQRIQILPDT